ncbi:hypothetical protein LEP1GSC016_3375 [Leptospira borgpetersenii serovar Hardjo-bovis str. Sponselee]|uniref:Uncharacterized protein n=1 Tax=Leptospira borgpetersenii serovar Hardjo-bovis str. Sponselee TaxID=1303729 RepID=M6BKY9_LEPBO|nr:hypothetical protein LEP1GSC016_3375 [Leptospira borgpetersenii serovar Hardjo-bovis str. Sponselee]
MQFRETKKRTKETALGKRNSFRRCKALKLSLQRSNCLMN